MSEDSGVSVKAFKPKLSPKGQTIRLMGWSGLFSTKNHLMPIAQGLESRGFGTQVFSLLGHDQGKDLEHVSLAECALGMAAELGAVGRTAAGNSHFILFGHCAGASALMGILNALYQPQKSSWLKRFDEKTKKSFFENIITFAPYLRGVMLLSPGAPRDISNFTFKRYWKLRNFRGVFQPAQTPLVSYVLNQHSESQQKAIAKTWVKESALCLKEVSKAPWEFFIDSNIPVQIICGEQDQLIDGKVYTAIHQKISHSEMSTLKLGDHWIIGPAFVTTTVLLMDQFVSAVLEKLK